MRITPDVDLASIPPNVFKMAAVLERFFRGNPEAWPSNATLGEMYGCSARQAQAILAEMERLGFVSRTFIDPDRPEAGRSAILARRRLDVDRAVAPGEGNFAPPAQETSGPPAQETSPEGRIRGNEEGGNNDGSSSLPPMEPNTEEEQAVLSRARSRFGIADFRPVDAEIRAHGIEAVLGVIEAYPGLEAWGGVRYHLERFASQDGYPEELLAKARSILGRIRANREDAARIERERAQRQAKEEADRATEARQRARWESLSSGEQAAIRQQVRKAHPWAAKFPATVENLAIAEMDA